MYWCVGLDKTGYSLKNCYVLKKKININLSDILYIGSVKAKFFSVKKNVITFLPINLNMCFGCSKEQPQLNSSFESHSTYVLFQKKIYKYREQSDLGLFVCT